MQHKKNLKRSLLALGVVALLAINVPASAQNIDPDFVPGGPLPPGLFPEISPQFAMMLLAPDDEFAAILKPAVPGVEFELLVFMADGQSVSNAELVVADNVCQPDWLTPPLGGVVGNFLEDSGACASGPEVIQGIVEVDDDWGSGEMTVIFPNVPSSARYEYHLAIDGGAFSEAIDPFVLSEERHKMIDHNGPLNLEQQSRQSNCRTNYWTGIDSYDVPDYQNNPTPPTANRKATYVGLNIAGGVTYMASDCKNSNQPISGGGAGYAVTVTGPLNPAVGLKHTIEYGIAYAGESGAGTNGFGHHTVNSRPLLALFKPKEDKINLIDAEILGYEKSSCSSWPSNVKDALSLVPANYWWSVVAAFTPSKFCSTNWRELQSGPNNDRDHVGTYVYKGTAGQKEVGGEIHFRAVSTGRYTMPFIFYDHIYGRVQAQGAPPEYFNDWLGGSLSPIAKVV